MKKIPTVDKNVDNAVDKANSIKADLLRAEEQIKAKDEHFKTLSKSKEPIVCFVCGADLTGHGMIEKNGLFYCAQPGCGYSKRGEEAST